jgi:SAM-dependent methyltransferase
MTSDYYNINADDFIERTLEVDMSDIYDWVLPGVQEGGRILDVGFGSGRDSLFFLAMGYDVTAMDNSESFVARGRELLPDVLLEDVRNMTFEEEFDLVWANASLLHLDDEGFAEAIERIEASLVPGGWFYVSMKRGEFEGIRDGRYFKFYTQETLLEAVTAVSSLVLVDVIETEDSRESHRGEYWVNAMFIKPEEEDEEWM